MWLKVSLLSLLFLLVGCQEDVYTLIVDDTLVVSMIHCDKSGNAFGPYLLQCKTRSTNDRDITP